MPAVSVIVPVYNVEQYIERCARSLFGQTLQDMEFVIIDDYTPDASMEVLCRVLEDYPARKPQVRIHRMPQNSGQALVHMKGLELATGEYVIHCDSDDEVDTDAYRQLYEEARRGGFDIVTCNMLKEQRGKWLEISTRCDDVADLLRDKAPWNIVCRLIRRSLLSGIAAPAGNMSEDMVIAVQATLRARTSSHVDKAFYRYYYRPSAITKADGVQAALARWRSMRDNVGVVLGVLRGKYGYTGAEPELVCLKYSSRRCLEPLVHKKEYYRMWRDTYPEVDSVYLRTPGVSLESRFWFVLIHLHLYHSVKSITRLLR